MPILRQREYPTAVDFRSIHSIAAATDKPVIENHTFVVYSCGSRKVKYLCKLLVSD